MIRVDTRIQPQAIEAEQSVLGSMMLDNNIIIDVVEVLEKEDFYNLQHQIIFEAIYELYKKHQIVDIISVSEKLKESNLIEFETVMSLVDMVITTTSAINHARIVKEKSQRRKLIKASKDIEDMAYNHDVIEAITEKAEKEILSINQPQNENIYRLSDILETVVYQLEQRSKNKGQISGLGTGFPSIDYKLGGLQNSDLIIIAARPGMGKTSLAVDIATNISGVKQIPTAFFSLEMSKEKIVNRILSGWGLIDNQKIKLGTIDDSDWEKIGKSLGVLSGSKLVIDDTSNIKAIEIKSRCRRIKNKMGGLGLIIVDHLTEMWRPHRGTDASEHEENVRSMKRLAKEMNCPVILLQQLNRGVEGRNDKRPQLSDLKETGAAEEVADVVMMIYRDDYYNADSPKKNIAEILIQKGRDVGTGTVELAWLGQYTKFANLERYR